MLGGSGGTNALGRYPPQSEVNQTTSVGQPSPRYVTHYFSSKIVHPHILQVWPGARSASACWSMVKSSGASVDGHSDEATAVPVLFIFGVSVPRQRNVGQHLSTNIRATEAAYPLPFHGRLNDMCRAGVLIVSVTIV